MSWLKQFEDWLESVGTPNDFGVPDKPRRPSSPRKLTAEEELERRDQELIQKHLEEAKAAIPSLLKRYQDKEAAEDAGWQMKLVRDGAFLRIDLGHGDVNVINCTFQLKRVTLHPGRSAGLYGIAAVTRDGWEKVTPHYRMSRFGRTEGGRVLLANFPEQRRLATIDFEGCNLSIKVPPTLAQQVYDEITSAIVPVSA